METGPPVAQTPEEPPGFRQQETIQKGVGAALGSLFRDENWPTRFWIVPLVAVIPLLNLILLRGWRFQLTRRLIRGCTPALPPPGDFGYFFINGFILWLMTIVFHLPHGIFAFVHLLHLSQIVQSGGQFWGELFVLLAIGFLLWALTWPLYRVSMLRFAATGSFLSFFLLPQNLFTLFRAPFGFFLLWLCLVILNFVCILIMSLLVATGIGALIALIFMIPLLYSASGHFYAQLGQRLALRHKWLSPTFNAEQQKETFEPLPISPSSVVIGLASSALFMVTFTGIMTFISILSLSHYAESFEALQPWLTAIQEADFPTLLQLIEESLSPFLEEFFGRDKKLSP